MLWTCWKMSMNYAACHHSLFSSSGYFLTVWQRAMMVAWSSAQITQLALTEVYSKCDPSNVSTNEKHKYCGWRPIFHCLYFTTFWRCVSYATMNTVQYSVKISKISWHRSNISWWVLECCYTVDCDSCTNSQFRSCVNLRNRDQSSNGILLDLRPIRLMKTPNTPLQVITLKWLYVRCRAGADLKNRLVQYHWLNWIPG